MRATPLPTATGGLTTLTEAIYYYGGEARTQRDVHFGLPKEDQDVAIVFLKGLVVVP